MATNAQVEFNASWKKQEDEAKIRALQTAAQSGKFGLQAAKFANTILAGQSATTASVAPAFTMPGQSISAFAMPGQGASTIASMAPAGTAAPGLSSIGASTAAGLGSGVGMAASGAALGSIAGSAAPVIGSAAMLGSGGLGAGVTMGAGIATTGIGTAATAGMGAGAAGAATKGALFAPVTMGLSLALAAVMIGLAIAARQGGAGGVGQSRKFQANGSSTETYLPKFYGKCRVGMNRIFVDTEPGDKDRLYIIGALGIGPIKQFIEIYFDDEIIATWNITNKTWDYIDKYKKAVYIEHRYGKPNNKVYDPVRQRFSAWTDRCEGKNIVSLMLMLNYDMDLFPNGLPNITTSLLGSNDIYDPRTGLKSYTTNLALCAADYMRNKLAGIGMDKNLIDYSSVVAEANYCDEVINYDYVKAPEKRLKINAVDGKTSLIVGEPRYYKVGFKSTSTYYEGYTGANITTERRLTSSAISKSATSTKGFMEITITLPTGDNIDQITHIELLASLDNINYYILKEIEYDSEDEDLGTTVVWRDNNTSDSFSSFGEIDYGYAGGGRYKIADNTDTNWTGSNVPNVPVLTTEQVVFYEITTNLDYYDPSDTSKKTYYRYKYVYTQSSNTTTTSPRSKAVKITKSQRIIELKRFSTTQDDSVDGMKVYRTPPMPKMNSDLIDPVTYPYKLCATLALNVNYYLESLPTASLTDLLPTVNNAVSGEHARYTCNGIVDTSVDVLDNLESIIFCGRLLVYFQGGKYRFLIRKPSIAEDIVITDDNVIGDYRVVINGVDNTANIIRGEFFDNDTNDQPNWVSYPPSKYKNLYLAEDNGFENVKEVTFNFVIHKDRAKRLCKVLRDEARFNLPVTVQTMEDLSNVKIGSVIKVTLESLGWNKKLFWVIGMGLNHNCTLQPILDQYVEETYNEIDLGQDISKEEVADTDLQDPTEAPDDVTNVVFTEEYYESKDIKYCRLKVTYTAPVGTFWVRSDIYVKFGSFDYEYYTSIDKSSEGVFYIDPVQEDTQYFVKILSVSTLGVSQQIDDATEWEHNVSDAAIPPDVTGFVGYLSDNNATLKWEQPTYNSGKIVSDIGYYEIREANDIETPDWGLASVIVQVKATSHSILGVMPGQHLYLIKAVDTRGLESVNAGECLIDNVVTSGTVESPAGIDDFASGVHDGTEIYNDVTHGDVVRVVQNQISNFSFETNLSGWTTVYGTWDRTDNKSYEGSYSVKHNGISAGGAKLTNSTITLQAGKKYVFQARVWSNKKEKAYLTYKLENNTYDYSEKHTGDSTWQLLSMNRLVTTPDVTPYVGLLVNGFNQDTHKAFYDDCRFSRYNASYTSPVYDRGDVKTKLCWVEHTPILGTPASERGSYRIDLLASDDLAAWTTYSGIESSSITVTARYVKYQIVFSECKVDQVLWIKTTGFDYKESTAITTESTTTTGQDTSVLRGFSGGSTVVGRALYFSDNNTLADADRRYPAKACAGFSTGSLGEIIVSGGVSGFSGLTKGVYYLLGESGAITTTGDSTAGTIVQRVLYATSATTGIMAIESPYLN